mmetsp:Transcript_114302/g.277541  ORF Transcript_114302/g.277541 Transcript_114302/m.277541 type:complete len:210 (-) Transcript_114302:410-1039(-)
MLRLQLSRPGLGHPLLVRRQRHLLGLRAAVGPRPRLGKVLLVVVLAEPEGRGGLDLGHDLLAQLGLQVSDALSGRCLLLRAVEIDAAAVLRPCVVARTVQRCCVLANALPEDWQELLEGNLLRVEDHSHSLGVARLRIADVLVAGLLEVALRIADASADDAGHSLERELHSPEAAGSKGGQLRALRRLGRCNELLESHKLYIEGEDLSS